MTRDEKIEEALNAMLEPQTESCRYDHHGLCQSHSLRRNDKGEPECEVALARAAIALPKGETKRDDSGAVMKSPALRIAELESAIRALLPIAKRHSNLALDALRSDAPIILAEQILNEKDSDHDEAEHA